MLLVRNSKSTENGNSFLISSPQRELSYLGICPEWSVGQPWEAVRVTMPILQRRKLRLRKKERLLRTQLKRGKVGI